MLLRVLFFLFGIVALPTCCTAQPPTEQPGDYLAAIYSNASAIRSGDYRITSTAYFDSAVDNDDGKAGLSMEKVTRQRFRFDFDNDRYFFCQSVERRYYLDPGGEVAENLPTVPQPIEALNDLKALLIDGSTCLVRNYPHRVNQVRAQPIDKWIQQFGIHDVRKTSLIAFEPGRTFEKAGTILPFMRTGKGSVKPDADGNKIAVVLVDDKDPDFEVRWRWDINLASMSPERLRITGKEHSTDRLGEIANEHYRWAERDGIQIPILVSREKPAHTTLGNRRFGYLLRTDHEIDWFSCNSALEDDRFSPELLNSGEALLRVLNEKGRGIQ